jgi:hypothetical protein
MTAGLIDAIDLCDQADDAECRTEDEQDHDASSLPISAVT